MKIKNKKTLSFIVASLLLVTLGFSSCVLVTDGDSSLSIDNQSSYAIYEVYLTEVRSNDWGANLLRGVLAPGEQTTISNIDCGNYDALIYDELGASCEISNVDLCSTNERWIIDNAFLSTCPIFR